MNIEGGASGRLAEVTKDHQLQVYGPGLSLASWAALQADGLVWTCEYDNVDPTGINDYFVYLRNDGSAPIAVSYISAYAITTVPNRIEVQRVTGTPVGGTNVAVTSRRIGGPTPNVTYQTGVDITGLTDGGVLEYLNFVTVNATLDRDLSNKLIVLTENRAIAFLMVAATGAVSGTMVIVQV